MSEVGAMPLSLSSMMVMTRHLAFSLRRELGSRKGARSFAWLPTASGPEQTSVCLLLRQPAVGVGSVSWNGCEAARGKRVSSSVLAGAGRFSGATPWGVEMAGGTAPHSALGYQRVPHEISHGMPNWP